MAAPALSTAEKAQFHNPYIAGRALGQEQGFVGRDDILELVQTELSSPNRTGIVLSGQRRISKTSIPLQLQRRLPSPPFVPVYFDLMKHPCRDEQTTSPACTRWLSLHEYLD